MHLLEQKRGINKKVCNLNEQDIDKLLKKLRIVENISVITGFISFTAFYFWFSFVGELSLIFALIPGCLWAWSHEMSKDIERILILEKINMQREGR